MAIPLYKLVCGNCSLQDEGRLCGIDGVKVDPLKLACLHIYKNFEDKGFADKQSPSIKLEEDK